MTKLISIQYLRGLAALIVVLGHNTYLLGGNWSKYIPGGLGVDVFFIISGFIMTFITSNKADSPVAFMIKRFFRIWPAFFFIWLVSFFIVSPERTFSQMSCTLYFCLQDYNRPGPPFGFSALGPPWTLSYEIMFYFIFSLSMFINHRYRRYVCALIFLASTLIFQLYYNASFSISSEVSPDVLVTHWWHAWIKLASNTVMFEFITGMLLAEFMLRNMTGGSLLYQKFAKVGLALTVVVAFIIGPQVIGLSGGFWLASVIVILVVTPNEQHERVGSRVLVLLGDISYSLYLIHYPVMAYLRDHVGILSTFTGRMSLFTFSITVSIVLATVMFRWIETPSIRAGKTVAKALSERVISHVH